MVNYSECSKIREYLLNKTELCGKILIPYIISCVSYSPSLTSIKYYILKHLIYFKKIHY